MVFKPHLSGLHVYDPDDPRGHASYSFVETVEENMAMFTKRQIVNAKLARKLQAGMAYPSILPLHPRFKLGSAIKSNQGLSGNSPRCQHCIENLGTKCGFTER